MDKKEYKVTLFGPLVGGDQSHWQITVNAENRLQVCERVVSELRTRDFIEVRNDTKVSVIIRTSNVQEIYVREAGS